LEEAGIKTLALLKQADAYAKRYGIGRTELFTRALRNLLPPRAAS